MKVTVTTRDGETTLEMPVPYTGEALFGRLGLTADGALLIVCETPVPHTEKIHSVHVRVIQVASGG
jgi:sulfur carrier protein ThiS